ASPWRSYLLPIAGIDVLDKYRIKVNLSNPYPALLGALAFLRNSGVMPKGWADDANTKLQAIGTGPYKLVEYEPTDHLTYARHTEYWNKEQPWLDGFTFKIMLDQNARIAALKSGQIQY